MKYSVEAKSRKDLRLLAHHIRDRLRLKPSDASPAVEMLELLDIWVPDAFFEIVEEDELGKGAHAETEITKSIIRIREDIYDRACAGNGRDRMTVVHEIAHLIMLRGLGFRLTRSFRDKVKAYSDPEWQAKCLAGELMMDSRYIAGMTSAEVARKCGVSEEAAKLQLSKI